MSFSWIHPPILEQALVYTLGGYGVNGTEGIKPHIWCLVAIWGRGRAESGGLFRRENFRRAGALRGGRRRPAEVLPDESEQSRFAGEDPYITAVDVLHRSLEAVACVGLIGLPWYPYAQHKSDHAADHGRPPLRFP